MCESRPSVADRTSFGRSFGRSGGREQLRAASAHRNRYLVDPASSHMLVSKIKPCMSKYRLSHSETANGSLNQL